MFSSDNDTLKGAKMTDSALTGFEVWRRRALALALVCTAGLLAACGGGTSSGAAAPQAIAPVAVQPAGPDPATGTEPPAATVPLAAKVARFAYVTNQADNTVSIYTVNAATGQLRHQGYAQAGTGPQAVAVDAAGRFAYVTNIQANTVSAYAIHAATGALTPVGAAVATGINPYPVTVHPSGRFAYVANFGSANVSAYTVDAATGALTGTGTVASGAQPISVTVHPTGKFGYVASRAGITAYAIDVATGALSSVGTSPVGTAVLRSMALHPSGKYLYAAVIGNVSGLRTYAIDAGTGALTSVGTDAATEAFPIAVTVHPTGNFAFVANFTTRNVSSFTIDAATGALGRARTVAAGANPSFVSVDAAGSFAYVSNQGSNDVSRYRINAATGELAALSAVSTRSGPSSIAMTSGAAAVTYTPKALYAAHYGQSDASAYTIDAATGAITHAGDTPTRPFATSIAIDPTGRFAYTTHDIQNPEFPVSEKFSIYKINPASGASSSGAPLTRTGAFVTAAEGPSSIRIEPSGRFAYVAFALGGIRAYRIDATTGALLELPGAGTGPFGNAFAIDPAGRFMYVANAYLNNPGSGSISAFAIDSATGGLTAIDLNASLAGVELTTGPNPSSVAVDPSGRFVYVTHRNGVEAYIIDPDKRPAHQCLGRAGRRACCRPMGGGG